MKRHVLTLDLVDDPRRVAGYKRRHRAVWPEVLRSLRRVGVRQMQIYALGRRLAMVMDVADGFVPRRDFARHAVSHPRCAEWEALMRSFQQPPPGAKPGEVWARMQPVFDLDRQLRRLRRGGVRPRAASARGRRRRRRRGPRPRGTRAA